MVTRTFVTIALAISCVLVSAVGAHDSQKGSFFKQRNPDDLCPRGTVPKLLSHESDCSLFYVCLNGRAVLQKCPNNLHFNARSFVCDFPQNAECENVPTRPPQGRIVGGIDNIQCPSENGRHGILMKHSTDCDKYYICDNGVPHMRVCQSGLHFNPSSQACDYPETAGCDTVPTRPPQGRIGGGIDNIQCPSENSRHGVLMKHETDCDRYYICDNGVPHMRVCQSGLHFNPSSQACDYPETAGCDTSITKFPRDQVVGDNSGLHCPAKNGVVPVLKKHLTDCSKFYICDNGKPHLKECQAGLYFNPKVNACDYPANVECESDVISKNELGKKGKLQDEFLIGCPTVRSDETVLVPNPFDCSKFFMCHRGQPHPRTCPSGLHFNRFSQECDYQDKAQCIAMERMYSVGEPSPFCPTVSGKIPIFYGHPTNCSIYYLCSHGLAYEFVCPARLHFNVRKKVCDYESVANCAAEGRADP